MDPTVRADLTAIVEELARALKAALGDPAKETAAVRAAVVAVESADAPPDLLVAEFLRDGHGDIPGAPELANASDDDFERWSDLIADECGY
jgi:hypothetical protein